MFKGMETEEGLKAAGIIDNKAGELEQTITLLSQTIRGFDWRGPDADRTRENWDSEQVRSLTSVVQALRAFSTVIKTQAQEQEKVSAA
jgi:hypothetical protein